MKRLIYQQLEKWENTPDRKPLLLQGARQVGKTHLMQHFAKKAYAQHVYLNFEEDEALVKLFEGKLSAHHLIEQLSFYTGKKIQPDDTLILFDEIQAADRVLTSLKYFNEQASEYHIIAAGSLLGVSIGQTASFPVGKVDFLNVYPMNFIEYLMAMDEPMLADMLLSKKDCAPLAEALHQKLSDHFHRFIWMGGMPEVVNSYQQHRDIAITQKTQKSILQSYRNDFSKYASPNESLKISQIWQNLPAQLARENKKFKLSDIKQGARFALFELAIEWLRKAGLIYTAHALQKAASPLAAYTEAQQFKCYCVDTGLLGAKLHASPQWVSLPDQLYTEFKGALMENYVAQALAPQSEGHLCYWRHQHQAEIDFVMEHQQHIYPIEVKSGYSKHKQSLRSFQEKYQPKKIIRCSPRNFTQEGCFINVPLYAADQMKQYLNEHPHSPVGV